MNKRSVSNGRIRLPEELERRLFCAANPVSAHPVQLDAAIASDSPIVVQANNVKSINIGDTVTGSIAANDTDELRFTATAGQRVYLDVSQLAGPANGIVDFALQDANGVVIPGGTSAGFNGSADFIGDFANAVALPAAGQYKLIVDPRGDNSTNYNLKLGNAPLDVKNVALGDAVTGSIEVPGATDEVRFNAAAGQRVYLDVSQLTGSANTIVDFVLQDAGGNTLANTAAFVTRPFDADFANAVVLPAAGQYKLTVDARGPGTADYALKIYNAPIDAKTINLGDAVTGSLDVPGATDELRFNATAGQRVYLDVSEITGASNVIVDFFLQDAAGNTLANTGAFVGRPFDADFANAVKLPTAGQYKLVVDARGDGTANYALKLSNAPLDVKPITLGVAVNGSIEVSGGSDEYDFTGAAGQRVYLDVTQITGAANAIVDFFLQDAAGNTLANTGAFVGRNDDADFVNAFTLPANGQYKLIVDGRGDATANYSLTLYNAPLEVKTIPFGDSVAGSIEQPGGTDEYRFNATAGQRLLLDVKQISGDPNDILEFTLFDPLGNVVFTSGAFVNRPGDASRSLVDLNVNGQYRFVVDGRGDSVPGYQLDLLREGKALVSGTAWTAGFRNAVKNAALGTAAGYDVRSQGNLMPIPWSNLNQVSIVFDTEVNPKQSDLVVKGRLVPSYPVTGFAYDAATRTATWTLGRTVPNDAITINAGHGIGAQFTVLPADVDQSAGAVNATDLVLTRNRVGHSITSPGTGATAYKVLGDLNADGVINAADLVLVRNRIGTGFIGLPLRAAFSESVIDDGRLVDDVLA